MKQLISKVKVTASANVVYYSELPKLLTEKGGMKIVQVILFSSTVISV
jgi:hypothetical protein